MFMSKIREIAGTYLNCLSQRVTNCKPCVERALTLLLLAFALCAFCGSISAQNIGQHFAQTTRFAGL